MVACPVGFELKEPLEVAKKDAEVSGGSVEVSNNQKEAVSGADVIYTKVWYFYSRAKEYCAKNPEDIRDGSRR